MQSPEGADTQGMPILSAIGLAAYKIMSQQQPELRHD